MSLGDERLSTTDEKGNRIFLFPAEVKGFFRKRRNFIQAVLIIFFIALPWLKWNGHQILLLDIPHRTFHFGSLLFKAHDAPLIFLVLAIATLSLGFVTALFGRVWCGWACPQTVFIDGLYRRIEIWIQGNYLARRKLAKQPWNFNKFFKISVTWILFFIISTFIAHSFVAYFVGSDRLLEMMQGTPKENFTAFSIVFGMTLVLLFDFGWFREQFCIIACPYGRIQSILMDKKSVSVIYDYQRGEPRKEPHIPKEKLGDCINCRRCVEVCPTGIDIRRGIQMECIGCTSCIDACDEIMRKVSKPIGLIRYGSEFEIENKQVTSWRERILRPRVLAYFSVIVAASILFGTLLKAREPFLITLLKAKDSPYSVITENSNQEILNHFKLHVYNQSADPITITISSEMELTVPQNNIQLATNSDREIHFFVKFPLSLSKESNGEIKKELDVLIHTKEKDIQVTKELILVGPY